MTLLEDYIISLRSEQEVTQDILLARGDLGEGLRIAEARPASQEILRLAGRSWITPGEYEQQDCTAFCGSSYRAGLIRAIIGQPIGQSSIGFRQPVPGGTPSTLNTQHPVRCQFAEIVAGRPLGDHE